MMEIIAAGSTSHSVRFDHIESTKSQFFDRPESRQPFFIRKKPEPMKTLHSINNIHRFALPLAISAMLASCGGGGGESGTGTAGLSAQSNSFSALVGTYVLHCTAGTNDSEQGTLVVSMPQGSDKASATIHSQYYASSTTCEANKLDTDVTITGQIRDLASTVNRTLGSNTVSAKVVEFRYDSLTLSKGTLSGSLPAFGGMTKVAYVVNGSNVYFTKGARLADGLGDSLTSTPLTKQ